MQPARAARITLKPWDNSDWPLAWSWIEQFYYRVADDESPKTQREFVDEQLRSDSVNFGVYRDGVLGGWIGGPILSPTLCEGHCLFKKGTSPSNSFWGRSTTVPAVLQAAAWMWALGIRRIICPVFEPNRLMIGLLEHIGATRDEEAPEGLKTTTTRQGKPTNVIYYSLYP